MKRIKNITLFCILIVASLFTTAQLPDGSIAPNFTATDMNGNEHTLYDYLDEGKVVVLNVASVAVDLNNAEPFLFLQEGVLNSLNSQYGELGTKEIEVFFVEIDPATTDDDIYGQGNINNMYNYTTLLNFPIFNIDSLGELFPPAELGVTNYFICQNRTTTTAGWTTPAGYRPIIDACPEPSTLNDAVLNEIVAPFGQFCTETIIAAVEIYNPTGNPITSLDIITIIDEMPSSTYHWTGNLNTYYLETIEVDESDILADGTHTISFEISNPNGMPDEDSTNNEAESEFSLYAAGDELFVRLETDDWPEETSWEITKDDVLIYVSFDYNGKHEIYNERVCLDAGEWYTLTLYDSYNDGMTAGGIGFLEMIYNNNVLFHIDGNEFTNEISVDFQVLYEPKTENDILSFYLPGQSSAEIDTINHDVNIEMSNADFLDDKFAIFTLSDSAKAYVDDVLQISGETRNDYTEDVVFTVVAEDGTEQDWDINIHVLAANDVTIQELRTYPNPATDVIYLNTPISGKIEIYNNIGELVFTRNNKNLTKSINVSTLRSGLYHLKIIDGTTIYVSFLFML